MSRVFNFNAGPSTLPLAVLEEAQKELTEYQNVGMSVMEMSHRSKEYDAIIRDAEARMKKVMNIPDNYHVLFLQGGASLQFSMIPMNILPKDKSADYVNTGAWATKAIKEAKKIGQANVVASSEDKNFNYIPKDIKYNDDAAYVHITSNNTIAGTQWASYPETKAPLVCDMSSDIMCREIDVSKFGLIYAGAQKNIGPAGVTIIIIRDDLVGLCDESTTPTMLNYKTHTEKGSMFNTPPTFAIYMIQLVLKHVEKMGGVAALERTNLKKAEVLYNTIDDSDGFYKGTTEKDSRSLMNVTFRLPTEELEAKFVTEATANNFIGLKGHRSVGGCRASIYNAMTLEGVEALIKFMAEFKQKNS